ncbi:MAG: DUF2254 domain-containing protein [Thermoguttaceae bacterium]
MSWIHRYRLRTFLQTSVWILPVLAMPVAMVLVSCFHRIEQLAGWRTAFDTASTLAMFGTMAASLLTFIVFLSSTLLLVLQIASAQLSPRVVGIVFRNPVTRLTLTLFTFTFTFTLAVLLRIDEYVPALTAYVAGYLCLLCVGAFLFLLDHLGRILRPSGVLLAVARRGHEVIRSVYPRRLGGLPEAHGPVKAAEGQPSETILSPADGVLLAFDLEGLVILAEEADCVIELVPEVGDFVAAGSPLFRLLGGRVRPAAKRLCQSVALGQERTIEQDPLFTFRMLVDVASKALSPAINDPTTAVLAIDQIHYLLRSVGGRRLDEGLAYDKAGSLRLVYRTPNWEDFVCLAVTEIRHFGGSSIQVVRRLRAMLENLVETLPVERAELLRGELLRLHRSSELAFQEPDDLALAKVSDLQGVGGKQSVGTATAQDLNQEARGSAGNASSPAAG